MKRRYVDLSSQGAHKLLARAPIITPQSLPPFTGFDKHVTHATVAVALLTPEECGLTAGRFVKFSPTPLPYRIWIESPQLTRYGNPKVFEQFDAIVAVLNELNVRWSHDPLVFKEPFKSAGSTTMFEKQYYHVFSVEDQVAATKFKLRCG